MSLNQISINDTTTVNTGIVYDISKAHGGATYTDLADALETNGGVPAEFREGGMSIKFIHTSSNKYVQYRLMSATWSINVDNWQGVDDEPAAGSDNLVKSGGVADKISELDKEVSASSLSYGKKLNIHISEGESILIGYVKAGTRVIISTEDFLGDDDFSSISLTDGDSYITLFDNGSIEKMFINGGDCSLVSYKASGSISLAFGDIINREENEHDILKLKENTYSDFHIIGKYISLSGEEASNAITKCTRYISFDRNYDITLYCATNNQYIAAICFYDINKNYINHFRS